MFQSMFVNGKEYIPSAEIAKRFGYTPDYISRLAREGKIVAANINRRWFIDETSLEEFIRLANAEKELRSVQLKKQRKQERLARTQTTEKIKKKRRENTIQIYIALSQSMAVFLCGVFIGLLGWTATQSNLDIQDFSFGVTKISEHITQAVIPGSSVLKPIDQWSVASVAQEFALGVREIQHAAKHSSDVSQVDVRKQDSGQLHFSDEVDVVFENDAQGVLRPVFKNKSDDQEYQIFVAPAGNDGG